MDERFRGKGIWIGVGALAVVFLCVMVCALGAMAVMVGRSAPEYGVVPLVQLPAGGESASAPQVIYGYGPLGTGQRGAFGPFGALFSGIGLLFNLLFFGLIFLVLFGLLRRLFWGHRYWRRHPWGRQPKGKEWKGAPYGPWGPWAWHCYGRHWEPEGEPGGEKEAPATPDVAPGGSE
jgi:hypothetical protein